MRLSTFVIVLSLLTLYGAGIAVAVGAVSAGWLMAASAVVLFVVTYGRSMGS